MTRSDAFAPHGVVRAFAYRLLWRLADLCRTLEGACLALSAGLMNARELREVGLARWAQFSLGDESVDAGLDAWERRVYGAMIRPSDRVLLVGCGTGRDLLALRAQGFDVTGLEQVPDVAGIAREHLARRGIAAIVLSGSIETLPAGEAYDAVIFAEGCFASMQGAAARVTALTAARAHLRAPGGWVFLSHLDLVPRSTASLALSRLAAHASRADWMPERGDSFSCDHGGRGLLRYDHQFGPGDAARECEAAGLRVVRDEQVGSDHRGVTAAPP